MLLWTLESFLVAQMVKNVPGMWDIQVQSLGQEDTPEERNGNPLQYSCLENSTDRAAWWATVRRASESGIRTYEHWGACTWIFSLSLDMCLGTELLGRVVGGLCAVSWGTSMPFFSVCAGQVSTDGVGEPSLLHRLPNVGWLWSFGWWPFWQVSSYISLWFLLHFSDDEPWWASSHVPFDHVCVSFGRQVASFSVALHPGAYFIWGFQ